jgi:dephospho-CoA kinase
LNRPLGVGLTGGIGCGKSSVCALFAALGVPVIDADQLARELVAPGQPALEAIFRRFGTQLRLPDGGLDRPGLRRLVFEQPDARQALEAILHPRIRARMGERLLALASPYVILAIPLLLETGRPPFVDRVLVVDCPEAQQLARASRRDGVGEAEIAAILATQASRAERLAAADDRIDNSGAPADLPPQVAALHRHYLALAKDHPKFLGSPQMNAHKRK